MNWKTCHLWRFINRFVFFELINFFQTFCTVSIRFQKSFIQRFSASSSLFIFPPWNCVSVNSHFYWLESNFNFHFLLSLSLFISSLLSCEYDWMYPENGRLWKRELGEKAIGSIFCSWIPPKIDKTDWFTTSYVLSLWFPQFLQFYPNHILSHAPHHMQCRCQKSWIYVKNVYFICSSLNHSV